MAVAPLKGASGVTIPSMAVGERDSALEAAGVLLFAACAAEGTEKTRLRECAWAVAWFAVARDQGALRRDPRFGRAIIFSEPAAQ